MWLRCCLWGWKIVLGTIRSVFVVIKLLLFGVAQWFMIVYETFLMVLYMIFRSLPREMLLDDYVGEVCLTFALPFDATPLSSVALATTVFTVLLMQAITALCPARRQWLQNFFCALFYWAFDFGLRLSYRLRMCQQRDAVMQLAPTFLERPSVVSRVSQGTTNYSVPY